MQMAVCQWKLIRLEVREVNIFNNPDSAKNQVPLLDRFWQAQCRLEPSYSRGQHELERLQNSRRDQVHQAVNEIGYGPIKLRWPLFEVRVFRTAALDCSRSGSARTRLGGGHFFFRDFGIGDGLLGPSPVSMPETPRYSVSRGLCY